jgi:hypothetical protein
MEHVYTQNTSDKTMTGVVIIRRNPGKNESVNYNIVNIASGEMVEMGGRNAPGELEAVRKRLKPHNESVEKPL